MRMMISREWPVKYLRSEGLLLCKQIIGPPGVAFKDGAFQKKGLFLYLENQVTITEFKSYGQGHGGV